MACQKGHKDIVDTLLKSGANVNLANTVRMKVLFSGFSYSEVVRSFSVVAISYHYQLVCKSLKLIRQGLPQNLHSSNPIISSSKKSRGTEIIFPCVVRGQGWYGSL